HTVNRSRDSNVHFTCRGRHVFDGMPANRRLICPMNDELLIRSRHILWRTIHFYRPPVNPERTPAKLIDELEVMRDEQQGRTSLDQLLDTRERLSREPHVADGECL